MKPFLVIGTFVAAAALVTAPPARAQTKEQKAGARAAAEAGGDAFDAGKYAEAADLFERAERVMHAPPHLLFAARSHAKLGHLVEARELYLTLTREHLNDSAPRPFRDAKQMGEKELTELEPRIAYVSLVVQGGAGASGVQVTRNAEAVRPELVGIPTPVNPGEYSYQAHADGMESTATSIKLREGARETVVLTLRDIPGATKKSAAAASTPAVTTTASGSLTSAPRNDSGSSSGGRPMLIGSIVGFGVGAVGAVVGTIFILKASDASKRSHDLYAPCGPLNCSTDVQQRVNSLDADTTTNRRIAIAGFVTAGFGIGAGVTLLLMDQNGGVAQSGASVTPLIGLNYAGVAGRF